MAPSIKVGDALPEGTFNSIAYTPELANGLACGVPGKVSTNDWKGKKVVLVAIPGAFTPTCHINHIPPFLEKYNQLKEKGVDIVAVLSANDVFVLSGWGRVEGLTDKIITLSDPLAAWSKSIGLSVDLSEVLGLGIRTARYAIIIDDLVVKYIEVEDGKGVTVSGVDAILSKL